MKGGGRRTANECRLETPVPDAHGLVAERAMRVVRRVERDDGGNREGVSRGNENWQLTIVG